MKEPDSAEFSARPCSAHQAAVLALERRPLDAEAQLWQSPGSATPALFLFYTGHQRGLLSLVGKCLSFC